MYFGVDYYPEHWPKAKWPVYAKWMKKAGFNVVRMAEFAWAFMEPQEGRFTFDWLDEAIGILGRQGISTILGTPTAVMPAWLAERYPECLATEKSGERKRWGVRKNNCFSTASYRMLSERITRAMADHYAGNPHVIGWQTDNEFDGGFCWCDTCRSSFHDWLQTRYGSLKNLNTAWGTHFWGHVYSAWAQIPLPDNNGTSNPSACLDWQRHLSWLNVRFQHDQVRILRKRCPKQFITHNLMGLAKGINYYDLSRDLDHVSWDNYPLWGMPHIPYDASMAGDLMRGVKRKNYWIMETTAGPGGWGTFGRNPRPGEIRKIAFQQIAHGADHIIWFRWRTCTAGREQYWHGLLGHDGKPGRRYQEAARTAQDGRKIANLLAGTTVKTPVAMIYDYDSLWATDIQPSFVDNSYQGAMRRYYQALLRAGVNVDMVPPTADLAGYKLVLAPQLYVLPDAVAGKLVEFVKNGGVLLADTRTGVKTETSLCHERTLPGLLKPALGIDIPEYECLAKETEYPVCGGDSFPGDFTAVNFTDWITPAGAEVLVSYEPWHMKPYAALTRHKLGRGTGWYVGAIIKEPEFYDRLVARLLADARIEPPVQPPEGVEVSYRQGPKAKLMFLLNHTEEAQTVDVPAGKTELLSGRKTRDTLELGAYEIAVVAW